MMMTYLDPLPCANAMGNLNTNIKTSTRFASQKISDGISAAGYKPRTSTRSHRVISIIFGGFTEDATSATYCHPLPPYRQPWPQKVSPSLARTAPAANSCGFSSPGEFSLTEYLEDHPRTSKWLGSPPVS